MPAVASPPAAEPSIPQYTWETILFVWAAAAVPMGVLGWIVAPAVTHRSASPVLARIGVLTVGLVWQFAVVLLFLAREARTWRWTELAVRLRLRGPVRPSTGRPAPSLWWWLIPLVVATAVFDLGVKPRVDAAWTSILPFLREPSAWALGSALATPAARSELAGAWGTWTLYVVNALFNTVLGEELLFRGLLLPRMNRTCGNRDWAANALLFGLYHLHQPWGMVSSVIHGVLFALPSRRFRCTWFGIVAHSGQSVYFAILLLGLVLGMAK